MKNLSPEWQIVATLQGEMLATQAVISALLLSLSPQQESTFQSALSQLAESARANLMALPVPEESIAGFDQMMQRLRTTQQLSGQH